MKHWTRWVPGLGMLRRYEAAWLRHDIVAGLGFVTELLSKPIRYGYMNGIALTVLISQLPKLFGFSIESGGPLRSLWAIASAFLAGQTNWVAFGIGLATLI